MRTHSLPIPVSKSFLEALLFLSISWILFALLLHKELWQLSFLPVVLSAYAVFKDVYKKRYFNAVLIFLFFSLIVVLVDLAWLYFYMDSKLPFFLYMFDVRADHIFMLAKAQLTLSTGVYAGYIAVKGTRAKAAAVISCHKDTVMDLMWLPAYLIGLASLVALIVATGGFGHLFATLGFKYERAAGRGWMILLQYFAYVGIIICYKKNIHRKALYRYGVMILSSLPMLLSGSRGNILIIILGALFIDEVYGKRMRLRFILMYGAITVVLFGLYQNFRGGQTEDTDLVLSLYKDLSMGIGYVITKENAIYGSKAHLYNLVLSFVPVLPGAIKEFLQFPESHNAVFTKFILPEAGATFSNGVWGESLYVIPFGAGLGYYVLVGIVLSCIDRFALKYSVLVAAVATGGAVRVAKGGLTQGVGNILMFLAPMLVIYLGVVIVERSKNSQKVNYVRNKKAGLHQ